MSGPICPDCGLRAFQEITFSRLKCKICGWKGKGLPRKIMSGEKQKGIYERSQHKLNLRKKGELFCIRIWIKGDEDKKHDLSIEIMELLDVKSLQGDDLLMLFVNTKPKREVISKVKRLKGVTKFKIY